MAERRGGSRDLERPQRGGVLFWCGVLVLAISILAIFVSVITLSVWLQERGLGTFGLMGSLGLLASSVGWMLAGRALMKGSRRGWLWLSSPIAVFVILVLLVAAFGVPVDG